MGETELTASTESGLSATCRVTVLAPDVLTEDVPVSVSLVDSQKKKFEFTPSESGKYVFLLSDCTEFNGVRFYVNDFGNSYYLYDNSTVSYGFEAGRTYLIDTSCSDGEGTYTLTVSRSVAVTDIILTSSEIEEPAYSTFTLNADVLPWNADASYIEWSSSDENVVTVKNGKLELVAPGEATVTASVGEVSASCLVRSVESTISVGESKTAVIDRDDKEVRFKFTPDEDGVYCFSASAESRVHVRFYDYGIDGASLSYGDYYGYDFETNVRLIAGRTYFFGVEYYYDDNLGVISVALTKPITPEELTLTPTISGYAGDTKYISYRFGPEGAFSENIVWVSNDTSVAIVNEYGNVTLLSPGKASITAICPSGLTAICEVTVLEPTALEIDVPSSVSIAANESHLFSFVPAESGEYRFVVSDEAARRNVSFNLILPDAYGTSYASGGGVLEYALKGGEEYLLRVYNSRVNGDTSNEFTLTVYKLTEATDISFEVGDTYKTSVGAYRKMTLVVEPWNASAFGAIWSTSDSTVATVTSDGYVYFDGVGTVVITATLGELSASCTVTVNELIPGDVNSDGLTNALDVYTTMQYLSYNSGDSSVAVEDFNESAADVYKDGTVNFRDVYAIMSLIESKPLNSEWQETPKSPVKVKATDVTVDNGASTATFNVELSNVTSALSSSLFNVRVEGLTIIDYYVDFVDNYNYCVQTQKTDDGVTVMGVTLKDAVSENKAILSVTVSIPDGITGTSEFPIIVTADADPGNWIDSAGNGVGAVGVNGKIVVTGHTHSIEYNAGYSATCEANGVQPHWECTECGRIFADENAQNEIDGFELVIPALGHNWGEWTVTKPADCFGEGVERRVCKNDPSHFETRTIPKLEAAAGDVNGDGTLNARDVIALMRFLTGWKDNKIMTDVLDVNGDGNINARDVIALMKAILVN